MKKLTKKIITTREWAKRNIDHVRQYHRRYAHKRAALIARIKSRPCMDCHGWFEPCQMEFDHRNGVTKLYNVSQMQLCTLQKVLEEIAKCDLVCSNCHSLRTFKRRILFSRG